MLCDGIQDPGNLGGIIRNAVALGADYVLLTGEAADIYNPKVVRASSGMIMDIPVFEYSYDELDRLKEKGYSFFVSQSKKGGVSVSDMEALPDLAVMALGSEGKGVSGEVAGVLGELGVGRLGQTSVLCRSRRRDARL